MTARSRACTSWARTRRCPTPTWSMRARRCTKLEHLVVQDIFLTETAWHADVVLPSSAHAEKWGTFTNTNRQVQIGRPVLDPPGEARQDWELIQELARRRRPRLDLHASVARCSPRWRRSCRRLRTSPGSGWSARTRSPIPAMRRTSPATRSSSRPASRPPSGRGQDRAGRPHAARRAARRGLSDGADHRPPARALAHGRHDAPRVEARRARAGGDRRA